MTLSLVGHVQADTANWTDGGADSLWSNPDNWDLWPMSTATWAKIVNGENGATLDSDGFVCQKMHIGGDLTFTVLDGAGLSMPQDLTVARSGNGTMSMEGGIIDVGRDFEIGRENDALVNMSGGVLNVTRDMELPKTDAAMVAHVNLNGGTINVMRELRMNYKEGSLGTMNITAGVLITAGAGDGNEISTIQGYVDNGWITAYGGDGTVVMDYNISNSGRTTVTAVHSLNPIPGDGGETVHGDITLSWTVDAGTPVDVSWGTSSDWTTWKKIVDKQAVTSVPVTVVAKQEYFWAVDTYAPGADDPNYGPVFSFYADNIAPVVDAGDDVTTWIDNGSVEVALTGTVIDVDPTTTLWTVVSEPDDPNNPKAVIADPAALNTTVTVSALGEYVIQLDANDGEKDADPDQMTINVYADSCLAAQSLPGFEFSPGDLNQDCIVDDLDLALLDESWLKCNSLDCPDPNAL
ncbi:hypothetical protein ACFL3F_04430 [Planctomycetota bacterium]